MALGVVAEGHLLEVAENVGAELDFQTVRVETEETLETIAKRRRK